MSTSHRNFTCICGGSYTSQAGLSQHRRRYCKGAPPNNDNKCPVCSNSFKTFSGMRQHMRLAHPNEYNADLEAESKGARAAWTEDEINQLAKAEADFEGDDIYAHLLKISSRTKDALKCRRRMASYKETVRRLQEERQVIHRSPVDESTHRTSQLESALKDAISEIPSDNLDEPANNTRARILEGTAEEARTALNNWCSALISKYSRGPRRSNNCQDTRRLNTIKAMQKEGIRPRVRRRLEYKLAQELYKTDLKSYAERLIDGRDAKGGGVIPNREELAATYSEVFGTPSIQDDEPVEDQHDTHHDISYPISVQEIESAIKSSKSNAAGSDGMSLADLRKIPEHLLLLLFNSLLLLGTIPPCLKKGRTILIPKKDKDLHLVANWRPLTISPVMIRLFNRILTARFSAIPLNDNQRGFTKIDGCFANYATIETVIKRRKKNGQPLSLIFLDISKAFDMVSHNSIVRALRRINIDPLTIRLIVDSYRNSTTTASCESNVIGEFAVNRGVKQGDPHSPFLFNAVLDELMAKLGEKAGVPIGDNSKLCALAYADDIVLAATNPKDAQTMLDDTVEFFRKRGLSVNASKCSSLVFKTVPSKKKVFTATEPLFKVHGVDIPSTNIGDVFSYLGLQFSTSGITTCTAENLSSQLSRIKKAPLKPQQKFRILSKFLIPRYISSLQRPNINKKILREADKKIRAATRAILSLYQHSGNAIFYAPQKTGGLGLYNFADNIPAVILSRWEKLRRCSPLLEDTYQQSMAWVRRLQRLIPTDSRNNKEVKQKYAEQLEGSYSGGLANVQNHKACRSFIDNPPKYWSGQDYIRALNLRYNLLPSKGMPSVPVEERRCRAGCDKSESLSHILQRCPLTHWPRIQRHDFIVKRIRTSAINKQWTVQVEPHIRCANGSLKKPDLVMKKNSKVIICDVGVHWEGNTTLEDQFYNKISTYSSDPFVEAMQQEHPNCEILMLPLIVGARGTWCKLNTALEKELKLNIQEIQDVITTAMRGSWITHQHFMRAVWETQSRSRRHIQ